MSRSDMATQETDREDLMREAAALVRRIELRVDSESNTVICGFRKNRALAVYFGADPVYQFDADSRLRRAFVDGLLYRTQGDTLAELKRHRTENATELLRHDLSHDELSDFVKSMQQRFRRFASSLEHGDAEIIAQVPPNEPIFPELVDAIRQIIQADGQLSPPIKGKR